MSELKSHAIKSQASVMNLLKSKGRSLGNGPPVTFHSLCITNQIIVQGLSLSVVQRLLRSNKEVLSVDKERMFKLTGGERVFKGIRSTEEFASWGIENIDAPKVWEQGINGTGILVGSIDTGVEIGHEALKDNFVGGNYGWFDPILYSTVPSNTAGHGSHVIWTLAGTARNIGVAPGVRWMTCRGCDEFDCPEAAMLRCGQWILGPTKADGSDPDCSKAPRIVNNSWGDDQPNEYYNPSLYPRFDQIIKCWRSAGIIPVFANGNSRSFLGQQPATCGSAFYPAVSSQVIGVGNVELVSGESENGVRVYETFCLGPAGSAFSQKIKPDVSAPGTLIVSSQPGDKYGENTGTSMATPHAANLIFYNIKLSSSLLGIWNSRN